MRKIIAIFFTTLSFIMSSSAIAKDINITNDNLNLRPVLWSVGGALSKNPATLRLINQTDKKLSVEIKVISGGSVLVYSGSDGSCNLSLNGPSQPKSGSCELAPNQFVQVNAGFITLGSIGTYQLNVEN